MLRKRRRICIKIVQKMPMQIKIDFKIFLIILIFLISKNIGIYAILMLFALIHELGHLLCGLLLGFKPESIKIIPFGFNLTFKVKCDDYNIKIKKGNMLTVKKILIALAGPFTNVLCIFLLFAIENLTNKINIQQFENAIYANILIILFNLIPIYPLDGGRIIQGLIHIFVGLKESYSYIKIITSINVILLTAISSVLILYYENIAILLVIIYLWLRLYKCNKEFSMKEKIYNKLKDSSIIKVNLKD